MRTALATALLAALASGASAQTPRPEPMSSDTARVVFVCEHGTVKSVIAAALFNRLAAERGLAARAVSRGTAPDDVVPALVRDSLRAEGADIGDARPAKLGAAEGLEARLFVAFDVEVPAAVSRGTPGRRWDGTPSVMGGYRAGRDAIAARVAALIDEITRGAP
jgi:ABC-type nitrate/sulfonate/bicarbonate transport system substrate-binding protein